MSSYYNEIDPFAAQWLRNLIDAGHIAPGIVDERSIEDIHPEELHGFTQCHFFAGIGAWSLALRRAGWPDDEPVWTGSCPCQPFSSAGKGAGFADERHLWPAFHHLIAECRPPVVFGEQVAGGAGRSWLSLVRTDLEALGYAVGASDLCAAGLGAPHIRQRLYWVADSMHSERWPINLHRKDGRNRQDAGWEEAHSEPGTRCEIRGLAHALPAGRPERRAVPGDRQASWSSRAGRVGDAPSQRPRGGPEDGPRLAAEVPGSGCEAAGQLVHTQHGRQAQQEQRQESGSTGFWGECDWLPCRDGKARPVEPGLKPLVDGAPARVGRLRAYGNAIVPQVAQAFVEAYLQTRVTA